MHKVKIKYLAAEDPPGVVLERAAEVLISSGQFFRFSEGGLIRIFDSKLCVMTAQNLNAHMYDFLEVHFQNGKKSGAAKVTKKGLLPPELVNMFLFNPGILSKFPEIKMFTRTPTVDLNWNIIATPGYHAGSGIYYAGPVIVPAQEFKVLEATYSEFCWKSVTDKLNFYALLLSGLTMPHWIDSGHFAGVFNGSGYNDGSGLGKSKLANSISLIIDGCHADSVSCEKGGEEFERKLYAPVKSGRRIVLVDNVKTEAEFKNATLEKCITSPVISFRIVRSSDIFCRPNDVLFLLTMNQTRIGPDLRRRQLPINLYYDFDPKNRTFKISNFELHVLNNRTIILGELLGMIKKWLDMERPTFEDSPRHSMGQELTKTMDAILRVNNLKGFLSNYDESNDDFDCDAEIIRNLCEEYSHSEMWFRPGELVKAVEKISPQYFTNMRPASTVKAKETRLGKLLFKFHGRPITINDRKFKIELDDKGSKNGKLYSFREVKQSGQTNETNNNNLVQSVFDE